MDSNFIYLVAGERNTKPGAISDSGGLFANVGMTQNGRKPEERFRDTDYRKKQSGGNWVLIKQWEVGSMKDHAIHRFLKLHPSVSWDSQSDNTEEFLFINDSGDGLEAIKIIESIMIEHCIPDFIHTQIVETNSQLDNVQRELTTERNRRIEVENAEPWQIIQAEIEKHRALLSDEMKEKLDEINTQTITVRKEFERQLREAEVYHNSKTLEERKTLREERKQFERQKYESAMRVETLKHQLELSKKKTRRFSTFVIGLCVLVTGTVLTSEVTAGFYKEPVKVTQTQTDNLVDSDSAKLVDQLNIQLEEAKSIIDDYSSRLDTKFVCLSASECTGIKGRYNYDSASNEIVCSVKVQKTNYTCKYTLKIDWKKKGYQMINSNDWNYRLEGHTIILSEGQAHFTEAPITSFEPTTTSYKITEYEAY